jgi:hypothetical protein
MMYVLNDVKKVGFFEEEPARYSTRFFLWARTAEGEKEEGEGEVKVKVMVKVMMKGGKYFLFLFL